MERAHLQAAPPLIAHKAQYAPFHLLGCLVGEGEAEDVPGLQVVMYEQIGNLIREHTGLARPCARYDKLRSVAINHRLSLVVVELFEESLFVLHLMFR